jgi:hypothetical protein
MHVAGGARWRAPRLMPAFDGIKTVEAWTR